MERFAAKILNLFIEIGIFWFWVWFFKPNIDSGLVWILALMYASIMSEILFKNGTN